MIELAAESTNDEKFKNQFADYLEEIAEPKSNYTIEDATQYRTIKDLIKMKNVKNFYSYKGSLTTPP
jgi:carbonic anhydrase